jgi:hypothetical protein
MKSATQLALLGTGLLLIIQILYLVLPILEIDLFASKIYQILNFLQIVTWGTIFNFFLQLFLKQNQKSNQNEPRN